jgi:hypothetical protein
MSVDCDLVTFGEAASPPPTFGDWNRRTPSP